MVNENENTVKILTDEQREFVRSAKKREQFTKTVRAQYAYRIRAKARQMIKDLQLIAEYYPEKEQEQIFNEELLLPFIKAVVNPKREDIVKNIKNYREDLKNRRTYVKNQRMFKLCNKLIETSAEAGFELILPDYTNVMIASGKYMEQIRIVQKIGEFQL